MFMKFLVLFMVSFNILNATSKNTAYILKTGEKESEMLELQHRVLAQDSYDHLLKAGLSRGKIVCDIGCGNGAMTEFMARTVGNTGHVYAYDISDDQIIIAKRRIENAGLTNVTFIQSDINSLTNLPPKKADIVYARMLLMHLRNPKEAIINMKSLLKTGGVLALQEFITSTTHASRPIPELDGYMRVFVDLSKYKGVDFDIGIKLQQLCEESGLKEVQISYAQHKLSIQQTKTFLLNRCNEWSGEAIKANLTTKEEFDKYKAVIESLPDSDESFYFALGKQAYALAKNE